MNRLKELRLSTGLSQANLAEATGTTQRNISYWESGKVELNLYAALRLAQIFQVDVEYLAGYSDEFNIKPDVSIPTKKITAPAATTRNEDEQKLIEIYRGLDADTKETLWSLLKTWTPTTTLGRKNKKLF